MQPTDILTTEHRLIEQVLNCLEKIAWQSEANKKLDKKSAAEAIDFCRSFADGCHHAKEEAHLFPAMEANGFSGGCSPVAVMQREHELGCLYIQGMEAAIEAASTGDLESLKWFVQQGQYGALREPVQNSDKRSQGFDSVRNPPFPQRFAPRTLHFLENSGYDRRREVRPGVLPSSEAKCGADWAAGAESTPRPASMR